MKKLFAFLIFFISLTALAQDFEFEFEDINYQVIDPVAKTCRTRAEYNALGTGNSIGGKINLPENPVYGNEKYTLVEIGDRSFAHLTSDQPFIKSITIPETVVKIGDWAFMNQEEILEIEIPEGVKSIGEKAFINNYALQSIILNTGLESLGAYVFDRCRSLKEIVLPSTLKTLDGFMWDNLGGGIMLCNVEKIVCLAPEPPTITNGEWYYQTTGGRMNTTLYVPRGSKEKYLNAQGWSGYGEEYIKELDSDQPLVFLPRSSMQMTVGQTIQITGQMYGGGMVQTATWTSSDEDVVKAEAGNPLINGVLTAVAPGTARVTFTVYYIDNTTAEASCEVTVKNGNVGFQLSHSNLELKVNDSKPLTVNLTGLASGKSTVTVTIKYEDGTELSDKCDVLVYDTTSDTPEIIVENLDKPVDIYTINGVCIMRNVQPEAIRTLSPGLYIIGDKKVIIK